MCYTKSFELHKKEMKERKRKKKKSERSYISTCFSDIYELTGESLGEGSCGKVETCINIHTGIEYAVKIIEKTNGYYCRSKILKEIEIYYLCREQQNIIQLIEYFEEADSFYFVFEKINGGALFKQIESRVYFSEVDASSIISDLAQAIKYIHNKGIAHRDLKPENVLCVSNQSPCHVKLCDFDLCSEATIDISTPTLLTPCGSMEFMAPEVVDTFLVLEEDEDDGSVSYNKKCDLWSLGVIMYVLLSGYSPFSGQCGSDCGWNRGESCHECQEILFYKIKKGKIKFPKKHWAVISPLAKDLIVRLLVKDSKLRLDATQVLSHPWIVNGGSGQKLETPKIMRSHTCIKDLEDFSSRAMAVNRAVEEEEVKLSSVTSPIQIPGNSVTGSVDHSPLSHSPLDAVHKSINQKRGNRMNIWDKMDKFCSIKELDPESDYFMKAFY
jgi:MAP kinase interacting serine/threonine kinase